MEAAVRPAEHRDAPRLTELLAQLGWDTPAEEVLAGLAAPTTEVMVAEADGRVVGLIAVTTRHHFHRGAPMTTIDTLVVDEMHRSQGVGQLLVDAAIDAAARNQAEGIDVVSHPRRVVARRFYERLGFEIDGNYFVRTL